MRSTAVRHVNKLLCLLLCAVFLGLLSTGALALPEGRCELVIDYQHEDVSVSNASFRLYRIADFGDDGQLLYTGVFSNLTLDADALSNSADDLYGRVEDRGTLPDYTLNTDSQGKASVSDLKPGAYLLVCEPANVGDYVYHTEKQVIFIKEGTLTLYPKSTRLPVGEKLISVKTVKIWDDPGYENKRPRQITVRLLKDGKTVSAVVLSEANNWSHTWNDLLPNANWSVEENVPKGYKSSVQETDNVFVITNQYKNIPQTGQVWWPVIAVLCLGLALIVIGLSTRRSGRNEA